MMHDVSNEIGWRHHRPSTLGQDFVRLDSILIAFALVPLLHTSFSDRRHYQVTATFIPIAVSTDTTVPASACFYIQPCVT